MASNYQKRQGNFNVPKRTRREPSTKDQRSQSFVPEKRFIRRQSTTKEIEDLKQQLNRFRTELATNNTYERLLLKIDDWQRTAHGRIKSAAMKARQDLKTLVKNPMKPLNDSITQLSKEIDSKLLIPNLCSLEDIITWKKVLDKHQCQLNEVIATNVIVQSLSKVQLIKIRNVYKLEHEIVHPSSSIIHLDHKISVVDDDESLIHSIASTTSQSKTLSQILSHIDPYLNECFGLTRSTDTQISNLFQELISLPSMSTYKLTSGDWNHETTQMERFLSITFGFRNIKSEYISHGIPSFRLERTPIEMNPQEIISFPRIDSAVQFKMTANEIFRWQDSYRVYADKKIRGMSKSFLQKALKGLSGSGKEAFLMKFVVRISTCPIMMEFDARIIDRDPKEEWPHRIKLVSVTSLGFAGRIHDVDDIRTYVKNWKDVYEIDPIMNLPQVYGERDFRRKQNGPRGILDKHILSKDLVRMARLRLRVCDKEKVQVVIESAIGLDISLGKNIGIEEQVRKLSAHAIRKVLQEDGPSYKNIRAIVFALPILDENIGYSLKQDDYHAFVEEFQKDYTGPIPVFIADQDMHLLAMTIARAGFVVSELNPTDSQGVFGEYWQSRGPGIEEKIALTTLGLLVQHHLINNLVLDPTRHHLIDPKK